MCKPITFQNFFYVETYILNIFGILSTETSSVPYKIYSFIVVVCFIAAYPFVLIKDLVSLNFRDALPSWFTFFGFLIVTPLSLSYYIYRAPINGILKEIEQEPFLPSPEKMDNVVKKLITKWWRFKNAQSYLFILAMAATIGIQIILSLVSRLTNADPNNWKLGYGEFVNITYSPNFEIVFVYQSCAVFSSAIVAATIIVIITGVLSYIATQFKILQHNLKIMLSNKNLDNSDVYWNALRKEIEKCVVYHIHITKTLKKFEGMFSIAMLFVFISFSCNVCFDMYRASIIPLQNMGFYRTVFEVTIVLAALFLINKCGETVTYESEQVANAVYNIEFVGTDVRFQKCLVNLIRQSQKPIRVKAGKFIDMSLLSYAQVSWHDTDFYKTVLEGTSLVFATYLINACGENVTHESNQIANTVYEIDFVGTDLRFQKSLVTLMRQSQKPIRVKAGKFMDISLIAYTQIMKTSYTIYAMLKTTNGKKMFPEYEGNLSDSGHINEVQGGCENNSNDQ
ncbi:hypothetical protein RN001_006275 [Aquatica leii]|uniref:Odorant receptor n=1 Tax=Aquatica leii TaxID=1421715 RepID=A0AAN7PIC5_9COLE|nr:hypothetical protein RN001_006275 [Aquatica leii]